MQCVQQPTALSDSSSVSFKYLALVVLLRHHFPVLTGELSSPFIAFSKYSLLSVFKIIYDCHCHTFSHICACIIKLGQQLSIFINVKKKWLRIIMLQNQALIYKTGVGGKHFFRKLKFQV